MTDENAKTLKTIREGYARATDPSLIDGCTEGELHKAFDGVADAADWRAPINNTLSHEALDDLGGWHTVYTAIRHFTATDPAITMGTESNHITADGYRAGPAGDY